MLMPCLVSPIVVQGPIVAMQLMRLCIRSSACQPVLLEQMEELQQALQGAEDELVESRTAVSSKAPRSGCMHRTNRAEAALRHCLCSCISSGGPCSADDAAAKCRPETSSCSALLRLRIHIHCQ